MKKEEIYLNLAKITDWRRRNFIKNQCQIKIDLVGASDSHYLFNGDKGWGICLLYWILRTKRTEVTFTKFKEIIGSGDEVATVEDGWIKIESENDLPKDGMTNYFYCVNNKPSIHVINLKQLLNLINDGFVSHYQKIIQPLPPTN